MTFSINSKLRQELFVCAPGLRTVPDTLKKKKHSVTIYSNIY